MRILVIGSGGREHALAWKLKQSPLCKTLYCAPGNPGTVALARNVPIQVEDIDQLLQFAQAEQIDFTVVGPELPLTLGIVDRFEAAGLRIFGPCKAAARLEGSKSFSKEIMQAAGVPTAKATTVTTLSEARAYIGQHGLPIVLKADGLAAGKGVYVCHTQSELEEGLSGIFGSLKADRVVIEQFLKGIEASFIVATDGKHVVPMASTHDYKRIGTGDTGLNTGGMGSVCPTPRLSAAQEAEAVETVVQPVLRELEKRGVKFRGFLYAGLMIDGTGKFYVLEFNARMGDPECQSVMRRMDSDLLELLLSLSTPGSTPPKVSWSAQACTTIVLAAAGYPESVRKGDAISGIELAHNIPTVQVFHAGTAIKDNQLVTNGGRVLGVSACGDTLEAATRQAYRAADIIQFAGMQLRRDIGKQ